MNPQSSTHNQPKSATSKGVREPNIMLCDLTEELIWPRVLRAPALALSPGRLLSGFVGAFLLILVIRFYTLLSKTDATLAPAENQDQLLMPESITMLGERFINALLQLDPVALSNTSIDTATMIRDGIMHNPLVSILLGIPIIAVLSLVGGSISRSTAFEFAQGRFATRDETVYFTLRRARQFIGAIAGPLAFSAAIFFIISLGGLLLSIPVVDMFGAVLYGFGMLLGIVATLVLVLHVVASPMIVPALSIEGTDAFDAIQRCYAYVVGRPLRYLIYVLILTLLGVFAAVLFAMIARVSIEMTDWAAGFIANDATDRALTGEGDLGATKNIAHQIISFWRSFIELLIAGYIISLFFTSATIVYLAVRRICDGQGVTEIWEPVHHN